MKKFVLLLIASVALSAQVGCGSKSSSQAAATPPPAADPGGSGGTTCQAWQVYTQVGCLDQDPRYCPVGQGYNPADGRCYVGTIGTQLPQGYWKNAIQVVNLSQFQKMLKDNERCYQSSCPTESWVYFTLQSMANNWNGSAGLGSQFGWYAGSSAAQYDYAAYYPQPQGQQVKINMITTSQGYWNSTINFQIDSQARPTQNGFEVIYRGYGTRAYNKRIVVNATYLNSDRSQLRIVVKYKDVVVADGTINRQ